ncbi:MAG: methenyltetrahydromethanopterin cyclohydrolase [Planctomycetota bacterium]
MSPNRLAKKRIENLIGDDSTRVEQHSIAGTNIFDFGIHTAGSMRSGIALAEACMGGLADVSILPCDPARLGVENVVSVATDAPLMSCLGCQYAGWPVQTEDFFAMGSGPMRLLRGREAMLLELTLNDSKADGCFGVLESDKLPTESALQAIAKECGVEPAALTLAVAPSTSIAGSIQIVARSIETAMHKLHELKFDVRCITSGIGSAPLPPPARAGKSIEGIGRTNDAMLYGATVTLWVDCDDEQAAAVIEQTPSCASKDYGRPFVQVFADYEYDFYKVDPALFSPARVTMHNLRTGNTFTAGELSRDILVESFGLGL